jgi:hypothetical protein
MIVLENLEQGSDEWFNTRLGVPTASRFKDIITPAKGDKSKSYKGYMYELIAERLIKGKEDFFKSDWMERGNEIEPLARASYEFINDVEVKQVGMIFNDDMTIGISPDGLIGENGGLEIKCPKSSTLVKYMLDGVLPLEYKPQVMGSLWISEREWWDFLAFHPSMDFFQIRVYRDEEYIKKMAQHIGDFVDELQNNFEKLKKGK